MGQKYNLSTARSSKTEEDINNPKQIQVEGGWRSSSVVKNTFYSVGDTGLVPSSHIGQQTPVPRDQMPSGLQGYLHGCDTCKLRKATDIYMISKQTFKKQLKNPNK